MLVDTHCHLQLLDYNKLGMDINQVIQIANANQVNLLLCVATHINQSFELYKIAKKFINIKISIGLHPNEIITQEPTVNDYIKIIGQNNEKVIAIGETGLDYHKNIVNFVLQKKRFRNHIRVAKILKKPLIIHTRKAKKDTISIMRQEGADNIGGVIHCFTEDWEMAQQAMDLGFYISFSGIITFNNSLKLQNIACKIPIERILVETDCPYLAPVPVRGQINHPANVKYIAQFLARLKEMNFEKFAQKTTKNYIDLFIKNQL